MYSIFLDGEQFPVAPSHLELVINNKNETVTLIDEGEINLLKKAGLTDITFELLLPNDRYPFAMYSKGFQPATYYTDKLEKLKVGQKSFRFIVNRAKPNGKLLFDTNMLVSLEDYRIVEDAEEGFDLVVEVNLKQYRTYGTKRIVTQPSQSTSSSVNKNTNTTAKVVTNRDATSHKRPATHKVVKGDTLWAICKKYYGKVNKTMTDKLAKANNIKNPNLIFPGQVIKLVNL